MFHSSRYTSIPFHGPITYCAISCPWLLMKVWRQSSPWKFMWNRQSDFPNLEMATGSLWKVRKKTKAWVYQCLFWWFKGKSARNHWLSHEIWGGVPVRFPLNQSIEIDQMALGYSTRKTKKNDNDSWPKLNPLRLWDMSKLAFLGTSIHSVQHFTPIGWPAAIWYEWLIEWYHTIHTRDPRSFEALWNNLLGPYTCTYIQGCCILVVYPDDLQ